MQKEYGEIQPLLLHTSSSICWCPRSGEDARGHQGHEAARAGRPAHRDAKALGGVPTLIPMPDVYQSLDKGVVDGAAAPWEAIHAFRLYEVAKNYTEAPFYWGLFLGLRQQGEWESCQRTCATRS